MSGNFSIARPYAKAAFEFALEEKQVPAWASFLQKIGGIVAHPKIQSYLMQPKLTDKEIFDTISEILGETLTPNQSNFLNLVIQNSRLNVLPEIATLFVEQKQEWEKTVSVELITAFPITKTLQDNFVKALEIRLQREVNLEVKIDKEIIGGAIIRAGDLVINGSVRDQLERMKLALEA